MAESGPMPKPLFIRRVVKHIAILSAKREHNLVSHYIVVVYRPAHESVSNNVPRLEVVLGNYDEQLLDIMMVTPLIISHH